MKRTAEDWAWEQDCGGSTKLVLVAIAKHVDRGGSCFVGAVKLAEMCGLGRRTVFEVLDRLEAAGLVHRERRKRPNRSDTSSLLTLPMVEPRACAESAPTDSERYADSALSGVQACADSAPAPGNQVRISHAHPNPRNGSGTIADALVPDPTVEDSPNGSSSTGPPSTKKATKAVVRIWDAYVDARLEHNPNSKRGSFKLTPDKRRLIEAARKIRDEATGERAYGDEVLIDAVRGWLRIPHNRGENDRRRPFNELDLILGRGGKNIQRFADAERQHRKGPLVLGPRRRHGEVDPMTARNLRGEAA